MALAPWRYCDVEHLYVRISGERHLREASVKTAYHWEISFLPVYTFSQPPCVVLNAFPLTDKAGAKEGLIDNPEASVWNIPEHVSTSKMVDMNIETRRAQKP